MALIRAFVCCGALVLTLTPAAYAADTSQTHAADEVANALAQWDLAQQEVADLQQEAQQHAANERMIAILKSEALRERQLNLVANATAMEQIASALANAARAQGDLNAQNDLAIANIKAAGLVSLADAKLANAMAIGRSDEILNARAQWNDLHQLADFISSVQAELNMSNSKQIGQERADAIHTPALVEEQNGLAMGADALLAADTVLQAGQLAAFSATVSINGKASNILAHAAANLANAEAQAAAAQ